MLRDHPKGNYRYLPGISAFSSGVVAMPGHEIVHVTLGAPAPWRAGFARIEQHLRAAGPGAHRALRHRAAQPGAVLLQRLRRLQPGLPQAPGRVGHPGRRGQPDPAHERGAGRGAAHGAVALRLRLHRARGHAHADLRGGGRGRDGRSGPRARGHQSATARPRPEAMREKARHVMGTMQTRLRAPRRRTGAASRAIEVYTAQPIHGLLDDILRPTGPSRHPRPALVPQPAADPGARVRDGPARRRPRDGDLSRALRPTQPRSRATSSGSVSGRRAQRVGAGLAQLALGAVAPQHADRAQAVGARGHDVEGAVADHDRAGPARAARERAGARSSSALSSKPAVGVGRRRRRRSDGARPKCCTMRSANSAGFGGRDQQAGPRRAARSSIPGTPS